MIEEENSLCFISFMLHSGPESASAPAETLNMTVFARRHFSVLDLLWKHDVEIFKLLISVSSAPGSKKRSNLILLDSMDKSGEVNHKRHHSAFKSLKNSKKATAHVIFFV